MSHFFAFGTIAEVLRKIQISFVGFDEEKLKDVYNHTQHAFFNPILIILVTFLSSCILTVCRLYKSFPESSSGLYETNVTNYMYLTEKKLAFLSRRKTMVCVTNSVPQKSAQSSRVSQDLMNRDRLETAYVE